MLIYQITQPKRRKLSENTGQKSSLPNENSLGQPIANNEESLRNFWNWFRGSKVVDDQGRPLVVYHGTQSSKDFSVFNTELGRGYFPNAASFHTDRSAASDYSSQVGWTRGRVMPVYLSINNPADDSAFRAASKIAGRDDGNAVKAELIRSGYNGMNIGGGEWWAFHPNQIKSAIGNKGTYNQDSDEIVDESLLEVLDSELNVNSNESLKRYFNTQSYVMKGHTNVMSTDEMNKKGIYVVRYLDNNRMIQYHIINLNDDMVPGSRYDNANIDGTVGSQCLNIIFKDAQHYLGHAHSFPVKIFAPTNRSQIYLSMAKHLVSKLKDGLQISKMKKEVGSDGNTYDVFIIGYPDTKNKNMSQSIKEFLNKSDNTLEEGLLDLYKKTKKDRAGRNVVSSAVEHRKATKAYEFWNNFKTKYAKSIRDKSERKQYLDGSSGVMRKQLINFVEINFLQRESIQSFVNSDEIMSIIDKMMANQASKYKSKQSDVEPTVQPEPSGENEPTNRKKIPRTTPRGTTRLPGSQQTLRYKDEDYILNNKGAWINTKTHRAASEEWQNFFNDEADWLLNGEYELKEAASATKNKEYELFVDLIRQTNMASQYSDKYAARRSRSRYDDDEIDGEGEVVKSTGNKQADKLLKKYGFKTK